MYDYLCGIKANHLTGVKTNLSTKLKPWKEKQFNSLSLLYWETLETSNENMARSHSGLLSVIVISGGQYRLFKLN